MNIESLLRQENMDSSLILSYGGGGNYGDELLLEVVLNMLHQFGRTDIKVGYLQPKIYATYHHDFGYPLVETKQPLQLLKAVFGSKNIVIAGGGLWGMDFNLSVFIMSALLWASRWLFGKQIYLLGVGYYNSTTRLGHFAAWLVGKAATVIVARDEETYANFRRFTPNILPGRDIAWYSHNLDLSSYKPDVTALQNRLGLNSKTIFITLRRFKLEYANDFAARVRDLITSQPSKRIVVALMEPSEVDPEGYRLITKWAKQFDNVTATDFSYNPIALLLFFKQHKHLLVYVGPQFHGLLTAHLSGVPYAPLVYDNKSRALLEQIGGPQPIWVHELRPGQLEAFVNTWAD